MTYSHEKVCLLYYKVLEAYESIISPYSTSVHTLNNFERVYVIQDAFILYFGLVNYGDKAFASYRIVLEELLPNEIFKFNYSGFLRKFNDEEQPFVVYKRFHGIWGEPLRNLNTKSSMAWCASEEVKRNCLIPSKCDYVSEKIPSIHLRERFDNWNGYLYSYIIYELSDNLHVGYAIYWTQNPHVHKKAIAEANNVEMSAYLCYGHMSTAQNQGQPDTQCSLACTQSGNYHLSYGLNCDNTIIDLLMQRIELHKANGWKQKYQKHLSPLKLCIAEHDMKYFIITRFARTKQDALDIAEKLFQEVHAGKYQSEPRYEYILAENRWKSEQMVYELVVRLYKRYTVLYQYRPYFLRTNSGQMSYDIFICGLNVAIEYQGKQHFEPVEIFGGVENFNKQITRDKLKKKLSNENGVTLVYINYNDDISPELIKSRIESALKTTSATE